MWLWRESKLRSSSMWHWHSNGGLEASQALETATSLYRQEVASTEPIISDRTRTTGNPRSGEVIGNSRIEMSDEDSDDGRNDLNDVANELSPRKIQKGILLHGPKKRTGHTPRKCWCIKMKIYTSIHWRCLSISRFRCLLVVLYMIRPVNRRRSRILTSLPRKPRKQKDVAPNTHLGETRTYWETCMMKRVKIIAPTESTNPHDCTRTEKTEWGNTKEGII